MGKEEFWNAMKETVKFFQTQIPPEELESLNNDIEIQSINSNSPQDQAQSNTTFHKSIHVYSHLDADGLSSAAILAKTLQRAKLGYQISILPQLESRFIDEIAEEVEKYNHFVIFSDFGTGQLNLLKEKIPDDSYIILDHHQPELQETPSSNHINPHYYEIDGGYEISGAGVCYYFAKTLNPENQDLAAIAIIGALGDIQNKGEKGTFLGLNQDILQDAIEIGKIKKEINLAISRTKPIVQAIAFTLPEHMKGLSGREDQVQAFLEGHKIHSTNDLNEPRALIDLTPFERKTLNSALVQYAIVRLGFDVTFSKKLISTFYLLTDYDPKEPISDGREMSSLLNSCGRSGNQALGIATLLGDKNALNEAIEENKKYRKMLYEGLKWAKEHIREYENIKVVYGGTNVDERKIGTIAAMLIFSDLEIKEPLIAYADAENNHFKISARMDPELLEKGIDLGVIMRESCQKLGIENPAGGHAPAAGAKIPNEKLKEFLDIVDEMVGEKLNPQNLKN